ncbi:hypothetical protein FNO01nite_27100 [Flavobacterium noncentrifugens]|uniref:DUF5777 domain-containing protein n=1 Tax=Flavobacterium noncentrifugens TaxID=1128970 RepID=A0A1G9CHP4_9FLAO|nr:DUF5777 family beta-barrel protein [Flavobacterium noncentrifugens]GEP52038.1 hypothetical protein FNO01nite_27100 [Flavobacterium noncentrifugens]SDK51148.1 hypothetical protein SAMN04487935_3530 [Flavobacterium noncentrifugens]
MRKKLLLLLLLPICSFAQEDLLAGLDSVPKNQKVESAFKAMKIVNLESTKLAAKKDFYLIIAHRFGSVKDGFEGFFGLDNAVTQIKFLYGLTDWATVAVGRSEQAYDVSGKFLIASQTENGLPVTIVSFNSLAFNNTLKESDYPKLQFEDRVTYVTQVLVSRKFSEKLSLELAPTFFHENFVIDDNQDNSQLAIAMGGRYKIAKRWSINMDYAVHTNRASDSPFRNPLSIGVDLETGGHVFQMHFTNSQGIHEAGFLGQTTGNWADGNVFFGFNLVRVF